MAHYNHGESQYVSFPDPRSPVFFREPPFYNDVYYRRDFRDQHPVDPGYGGHLVPYNEQIFLRREDPWWRNHEFPHNGFGYPVYIAEHQYPREAVECTVKLYAPQLCCDDCEHRVVEALNDFPGVRNVVADQWEKKSGGGGGESATGAGASASATSFAYGSICLLARSVAWDSSLQALRPILTAIL